MSNRYKGGVISATPPTTTGGNDGVASGAWTLEQQMQAQAAGLWPNQPVYYIEDVFSTYLYTGNGGGSATGYYGTQTITNGVDLSTKGGMVWLKARSSSENNRLADTVRGVNKLLVSDAAIAQQTAPNTITAFNTTGFNLGSDSDGYGTNTNAVTYASWTFRKQPKFFDVVTYTGNGTAGRAISHALASTPGFIAVKQTSASGQNWKVWHRAVNGGDAFGVLNTTSAFDTTQAKYIWGNNSAYIAPTSTDFTVSNDDGVNANGATYVAYLFAHDAGGFGLTGTDNVISCGSYTGNGSATGVFQNLGFEPQWILTKCSSLGTEQWHINDNMRGVPTGGSDARLEPSRSVAEAYGSMIDFNATGFTPLTTDDKINGSGQTYIYIAIRRGPMKVPTDPTKVFAPVQYTSATTPPTVTTGFPVDMIIDTIKGPANENRQITDRLRGSSINFYNLLYTNSNVAEQSSTFTNAGYDLASNTSTRDGFYGTVYGSGYNCITWNFRRAPNFFDEVCYTGTGSQLNVNHNLGSVPELIIVKNRNKSGGENWAVYSATLGAGFFLWLNATDSVRPTYDAGRFPVAPTSSVFTVGSDPDNGGSFNYVAYLFATCPGVSKVGSYTGTGGTQTIACGFTAGARFVLIKRTDSTGDWWVWDTSRGMVSGTDPRLALNIQTGESTGNWVYTTTGGFQIVTTDASVNASGGTYIFLAIA